MYVCLCNAITEHDIQRAADAGVGSFEQLQARTGCGNCCGCCESEARRVLQEACVEGEAGIALAA